jgi:hypothetical protein
VFNFNLTWKTGYPDWGLFLFSYPSRQMPN